MVQLQILATTGIDLDQQILFRQVESASEPSPPSAAPPASPSASPSTSPSPSSEEPLDPSKTLFDLGIKAHDTIVLRVSPEAFHRSLTRSSGKEEEGFLGTKLISNAKGPTKPENQTSEQSPSSSCPTPTPNQSHVQSVVEASVDQWACGRCTYLNSLSDDVCAICNLHKSGVEIPAEIEQRQNNNNNDKKQHHNTNTNNNRGNNRGRGNRGNYQGSGVGRGMSHWTCKACTFDNVSNAQKCSMCDSKRS